MAYTITRTYNPNSATFGVLTDDSGTELCKTLELPWQNNTAEISCIPEGQFNFQKFFSGTLGWVYRLQNVPNRSLVDIHAANICAELRGCIAVGLTRGALPFNGITYPAVLESKAALQKLFSIIGTSGTIVITSNANQQEN